MKGGNGARRLRLDSAAPIPAAREEALLFFLRAGHTPAQIARSLRISRQALHQRIKRLVAKGRIEGGGRPTCKECGRPLPPPPEISEAARQLVAGKGSADLGRLGAEAKKRLDSGKRRK